MKTRDITFHGYFINALRSNTKLAPKSAIAELIDNALDAGAKEICVSFDKVDDCILISDDGEGCDDLARFAEFGAPTHPSQRNVRVGRYGVGGKQASALLCNEERVISVRAGVKREARIHWGSMAAGGSMTWQELEPKPVHAASGTVIELSGLLRAQVFSAASVEGCKHYWRKIYTPAIKHGLSIKVNGELLERMPDPKLVSRRQWRGEFEGKHFRAVVGVLSETVDPVWEAGWYVSIAGRLTNHDPLHDGLDEWPGADIWGYFELIEGEGGRRWSLDTNKLDFAEREEFFDAVVPTIADLLDEAMRQSKDVETGIIEDEMSDALAAVLGGSAYRIKEKRGKGETTGTVIPMPTGRKREKAAKTDPMENGSVIDSPEKYSSRWRFSFREFGKDGPLCKPGFTKSSCWVHFNSDNAYVMERSKRVDVLMALATQSIWYTASDPQRTQLWTQVMPETDPGDLLLGDQQSQKWFAAVLNRYAEHQQGKQQKRKAV